MLRKTLCCLLCCIAILSLTATSVFAFSYYDGPDGTGSISFNFNDDEIHVTGGSVDLRMVARWDDGTKKLVWCEGYEDLGLDLYKDLDLASTAAKLFLHAETEGLPAQSVAIGADGTAKVEDLPFGTYLVSQMKPFEGCYCMTPALISVPLDINGEWVFDVEASPKLEPLVIESTVPSTTVPEVDIPPTGQTNWPIPLLILGGCFLILLGLCVRKGDRHETNP